MKEFNSGGSVNYIVITYEEDIHPPSQSRNILHSCYTKDFPHSLFYVKRSRRSGKDIIFMFPVLEFWCSQTKLELELGGEDRCVSV